MDCFFGFHSLILFLKAATLVNAFNSKGSISKILGPRYEILLLPWTADFTFNIANSEIIRNLSFISHRWKVSLKIGGGIFQYTLNISVVNTCRFLVCVVIGLSLALIIFQKMRIYPRIKENKRSGQLILLLSNITMEYPNKKAIAKLSFKKWIH